MGVVVSGGVEREMRTKPLSVQGVSPGYNTYPLNLVITVEVGSV